MSRHGRARRAVRGGLRRALRDLLAHGEPRAVARRAAGGERGVGTVVTAGVCLALVAVAAGVVVLVLWLGSITRAQGIADLAALAAASDIAKGGPGCKAADLSAEEHGARVAGCRIEGQRRSFVVEVTVRLDVAGLGVRGLAVERAATAGTG